MPFTVVPLRVGSGPVVSAFQLVRRGRNSCPAKVIVLSFYSHSASLHAAVPVTVRDCHLVEGE